MRVARFVFSFLLVFGSSPRLNSQQSATATAAQRDPQALTILNHVLAASGGVTALTGIRDVSATGNVTYYWAGQEVQGTAKAFSRGADQFRLDAALPQGMRSWVVNQGTGALRDVDGTIKQIHSQNAINLGGLTFPLFELLQATRDTSITVQNVGPGQLNGHQVYQIRLQRNLTATLDPMGILSLFSTRDYFIDASIFQLLRVQDTLYPEQTTAQGYSHALDFSDYRNVNGVLVPFAIGESSESQLTFSLQLSTVAFNTGLTNSSFVL